jgi:hypothetical protein
MERAPSVSKEIAITPDGKAVVTVVMSLGDGQAFFRPMLGKCSPICGKAGHEDNDKPHVRNEACWNWQAGDYLYMGEVRDTKITLKPTVEDLL